MNRRLFLNNTALAGAGLITGANTLNKFNYNIFSNPSLPSLMGGRFVTLLLHDTHTFANLFSKHRTYQKCKPK